MGWKMIFWRLRKLGIRFENLVYEPFFGITIDFIKATERLPIDPHLSGC